MPVINSNPLRNTGSDGMGIDDALKRARTAEAIAHGKLLIMLRADIQIQTVKKVPTTSVAALRQRHTASNTSGFSGVFVDYTCGLICSAAQTADRSSAIASASR
jgi:hypothetical protein